jgi:hypothetical protein
VRVLRKLSVALLCGCAFLTQPAASAQTAPVAVHPLVGIGDENLEMFSDPGFLALGIKQVRFYVSWDVLSGAYKNPYRRDVLAAWLGNARALGLTPLITFDRSDRSGRRGRLPSVAQYSTAFLAFRKAYPWVTEFATWNEANYYGEPTARNPRRVAGYYLAMRRDCPTCTILAAELLDLDNPREAVAEVKWARELIHYARTQPEYWGLHNYASANTLSKTSVKQMLRAVTGNIWLTETGGIVALPHHGKVGFPLTSKHQAQVDDFLLNKLPSLSPRIQRVYLYEWRSLRRHASWDSALVSYAGTPRPAYDVVADTLADWGIEPDCAVSQLPPRCRLTPSVLATGSTGSAGSTGSTGSTGATASTGSTGSSGLISLLP